MNNKDLKIKKYFKNIIYNFQTNYILSFDRISIMIFYI